MKQKNIEDSHLKYEEKVQDIKKRKRALRHVQDPKLVKKMKKDLKREYRGAKHSEKNEIKKWIKIEANKNGYDF
jgi:hypothetical protein